MDTGTFQNIRVNLPIQIITILSVKVEEEPGKHGKAVIVALLDESIAKTAIERFDENTNIKVVQEGQTTKTLFSGIPTNISVHHIGNVYHITIQAFSYSILLDLKKKNRSFQNIDNTYESIFLKLVEEYRGNLEDYVSQGITLGQPFFQWQETDWEFIKRLASHFNAQIFTGIDGDVPQITVGIGKTARHTDHSCEYQIQKDRNQYLSYIVTTTDSYNLGDEVKFKNQSFVIAKKTSKIKAGRMHYTYLFMVEDGVVVRQCFQNAMTGASIEGRVLKIEKDKVKLHLSMDEEQNEEDAYWFPLSTSYSAEGSTGWYAIPEIGENVMLYLPDRDEANAYVIKTIRTDGAQNDKTQDPKTKYFGTKDGKEMILSPSQVSFQVLQNGTSISLSDQKGICVYSPNTIAINAGKELTCECNSFSVNSKDKIIMATSKTSIVVDNVTHIIG